MYVGEVTDITMGGVVRFRLIQPGGEGGHVPSNTEYFNVLLEVRGPPLGTPITYYPHSSPYLLLPLLLPLPTIPLVHGVR